MINKEISNYSYINIKVYLNIKQKSNVGQSIEKIFNEYKIRLALNMDYVNSQIQKNNSSHFYKSKFNLEYLHQFKLLMGNLTIDEMIEFIDNSIESKGIKIEESKKNIKLILISTIKAYPNVELILNEKNIIDNIINEINGMKINY